MTWTYKEPDYIDSLDAAFDRFKSASARALAKGFVVQMESSAGRIPTYGELDLSNFPSALEHAILCAIKKPDRCTYKIVGEAVKQRLGFNPAGRNYYDFVPEERLEQAKRAMHMVIDTPCGFRAEIQQAFSDGRSILIEALALPIVKSTEEMDGMILFCDQAIERLDSPGREKSAYLGSNVVHRDLIDLGFGIDKEFRDRMQTN